MRYVVTFIFSVIFFSCKSKDDLPKGILKPGKMQDVFWDYIRSDVYTTEYLKKDSNKNAVSENLKLQEQLFKIHNVTREEFYRSYTYYSNHKDLMTKMLDSLIAKREREKPKPKPVKKSPSV